MVANGDSPLKNMEEPLMTTAIDKLKSQLEALTNRERAEVAHYLISSLDQEQDEDAEEAWDAELNRRVAEIKSGKAVGKPAEQVFAELREKYS
jgi:putative addiction module component (TIGR02574 family)